MIQDSLITAASFTPNSLQPPNAWVGHLPFAAWVIREVAPNIFVELGTHSGNSYFTFCQSVVEAGISTKCYAVDTWQGDEHSGQYNEEIFAKVKAHHQEHYAGFSQLLRMTFDNAASYFTDESIELLHIDGLHTYEAVRHDFETWLPKLAPGAVVMFHDTNVRERNFGVWKLWEELREQYPLNIEFIHSHGLGVLQLDNGPAAKQLSWLISDPDEQQILIKYFAAIGTRQVERYELNDLHKLVGGRDGQITNLSQAVAERDGQMVSLNQMVAERDNQIFNLNHAVHDKDVHIHNLDQVIVEREGQIASLSEAISEREGQIASLSEAISEREGQIASLSQSVAERDGQIVSLTQAMHDKEAHIHNLDQVIVEHEGQIASLSEAISEREGQIASLNQIVKRIFISTSWRLTRPLRIAQSFFSKKADS
ncbi:MAG: class I SAM-dependent methyltransferase [Gallionellaceae bacterium]|nr:class I SAM-dependent methyltransferase [Gallionellaceae bacterium]